MPNAGEGAGGVLTNQNNIDYNYIDSVRNLYSYKVTPNGCLL